VVCARDRLARQPASLAETMRVEAFVPFSKLHFGGWRIQVNHMPASALGIDTADRNSHNWENWENWHRAGTDVISRRVLIVLLAAACVFPLAIAVLLGVGRLLGAMQDESAAAVLDRVALGIAILWAINLLCLILAQGINALGPPDEGS
jgi:hypothetical protein